MVAMASSGDVLDILNAWYPSLECVSSKLIGRLSSYVTLVCSFISVHETKAFGVYLTETFEKVNSLASYRLGGIQDVGVVSAITFSRFSLRYVLYFSQLRC